MTFFMTLTLTLAAHPSSALYKIDTFSSLCLGHNTPKAVQTVF